MLVNKVIISDSEFNFLIIRKILLAFSLTLLFSCQAQQVETRTSNPNVLFIAVDDLRIQLGIYGDTLAVTPNIDRLAAMGTVFNRAYAQQAVCAPSRASLMTGKRPNSTKVWDLKTHFRKTLPDVVTLPQHFKRHGYHAQSVGKIYHDPQSAQDSLSWSVPETMAVTKKSGKYVLPENLSLKGKAAATEMADVEDIAYIDGKVKQASVEILNGIKDKPFFLAVGFRRPHLPFSAPEKYWDLYDRESMPIPDSAPPVNVPEVAMHNGKELRGYTDIPGAGPISEEKVKELIHGYYASISYVDAQIGELLDELDRLKLTDNTIVVLWSDHGFHLGENSLWCKTTNFELDTRVPLIIADPSQKKKNTRTEGLVELVDIYPTLVDIAGLPVVEGLEGTSLKPLLENTEQTWEEPAFSQFPRPFLEGDPKLMGYSVRTDKFRYTEWRNISSGMVEAKELYKYDGKTLVEKINIVDQEEFSMQQKEHQQLLKKGFNNFISQ